MYVGFPSAFGKHYCGFPQLAAGARPVFTQPAGTACEAQRLILGCCALKWYHLVFMYITYKYVYIIYTYMRVSPVCDSFWMHGRICGRSPRTPFKGSHLFLHPFFPCVSAPRNQSPSTCQVRSPTAPRCSYDDAAALRLRAAAASALAAVLHVARRWLELNAEAAVERAWKVLMGPEIELFILVMKIWTIWFLKRF